MEFPPGFRFEDQVLKAVVRPGAQGRLKLRIDEVQQALNNLAVAVLDCAIEAHLESKDNTKDK